jgi:hypothetical protein
MRIGEQESAYQFLERFYGFSDSVIRSISLRYLDNGSRDLEIHIATRDSQTEENDGWVCVEILIKGVLEMTLRETAKTTNQVLPGGIHLREFNGSFGVEFGGAIDLPQSVHDLKSSDAYAVGSEVSFKVRAY